MLLTDEQRAMLQLLLQSGQTYADISSLLGLDVEAVQSRARVLCHGCKLDAHPLAGLAIAHHGAGAHIAARNFKNHFY